MPHSRFVPRDEMTIAMKMEPRHEGLRRYPRRGAMTCAETGEESKDRPKKRTPA